MATTDKDNSKTAQAADKTPPDAAAAGDQVVQAAAEHAARADEAAGSANAAADDATKAAEAAKQAAADAQAAVDRAAEHAANAGLTMDDIKAAFDNMGDAPALPLEDLQSRVARLEIAVFKTLRDHFGGKVEGLNTLATDAEADVAVTKDALALK